jgi:hypothetical protein
LSGAEIEELYAAKILLKAPGEAAAAAAS